MAKTQFNFETVRELALEMKDVQVATSYGADALKVKGNTLACVPVNKSAEPNSAVLHIDMALRASLIEAKPEVYYVTDHYAGYPTVLVRLAVISRAELREVLGLAWSFVAAKKPVRAKAKAKRSRR